MDTWYTFERLYVRTTGSYAVSNDHLVATGVATVFTCQPKLFTCIIGVIMTSTKIITGLDLNVGLSAKIEAKIK